MRALYDFLWYIFDLDGTILDSRLAGVRFMQAFASKHELPIPSDEDVLKIRHEPLEVTCLKLWPNHNFSRDYLYEQHGLMTNYVPFEDSLPIIKDLHARGKKIGIISNRKPSSVEAAIDSIHMDRSLLSYHFGCGEMEIQKPSPEAFSDFLAFIKKQGISRVKCLYIGDTDADYKSARGAGIPCVIVTTGVMTKEQLLERDIPVDVIITSLRELVPKKR